MICSRRHRSRYFPKLFCISVDGTTIAGSF
jgi:hypothetical protein